MCWYDANPFAGGLIYQLVRADTVIKGLYAEFGFGLPVQDKVEIAGKYFPSRAIG